MGNLLGGSENNIHHPYNSIYPHQHNRQKHLKMDKPTKRRRSASPINSKLLPRPKRPTLLPIRSTPAFNIKTNTEFAFIQPPLPTTPFNATVDSINERATRLELGNGDSQDIEMETCSQSYIETDEEKSNEGEEIEKDEETKYNKAIMSGSHASTISILPLHKPHPIAYQQHLALIASNRSKITSHYNHQLNYPKKITCGK